MYMHMPIREGCGLDSHVLPFEPEWAINFASLLLSCGSYSSFTIVK